MVSYPWIEPCAFLYVDNFAQDYPLGKRQTLFIKYNG